MAFRENLLQKIRIDQLAGRVLATIGALGSEVKLDKEAMRQLLSLSPYSPQRVRDLDLYVEETDAPVKKILVLDNELPIYRTTVADVAMRKSPTVGEMAKIWNIIKILRDSDVKISRKADSLKAVQDESIARLDLSFNAEDINDIRRDGIRIFGDVRTAQGFVTTDLDDNQITAFHPGAMNASHENRVGDVADIALGIVAPDGRDGMRAHVEQFAQAGIPFVFDPGQGLPLFSGPELIAMIDAATFVAVNDYEGRLLAERTGLALEAIAQRVDALIVTMGGEGARIHAGGATIELPVVPAAAVVDPTGCGDAFRAGLLYGIVQGWDWERTGRLAATLGSIKIASRGGQNHTLSRDRVASLHYEVFNAYLW